MTPEEIQAELDAGLPEYATNDDERCAYASFGVRCGLVSGHYPDRAHRILLRPDGRTLVSNDWTPPAQPEISEIKPAMTAEQWENSPSPGLGALPDEKDEYYDFPHAVAAQALYGQSFGFTREDVEEMETAINGISLDGMDADPLRSIRDRILALLPPEDTPE